MITTDELVLHTPGIYRGYHGTSENFDIQDIQRPAYFSPDPDVAAFFCRNAASSRVIDAILVPQNPVTFDFHGNSWGSCHLEWESDLFDEILEYVCQGEPDDEKEYWEDNGVTTDLCAAYFNEILGHDLVVFYNVIEEDGSYSSIYVAFDGCDIYDTAEYFQTNR